MRWPRLRTWLRDERGAEHARRSGAPVSESWVRRDIAHWLAQPAPEPVGVAVSPLVKRNGNGHGNGHGTGGSKSAVLEAEPPRRESAADYRAAPIPERSAATGGERARVPASAALLDLFHEASAPAPSGTSPFLTTVLDVSAPAPGGGAGRGSVASSLPDLAAAGEPLFALPAWALVPAPTEIAEADDPPRPDPNRPILPSRSPAHRRIPPRWDTPRAYPPRRHTKTPEIRRSTPPANAWPGWPCCGSRRISGRSTHRPAPSVANGC